MQNFMKKIKHIHKMMRTIIVLFSKIRCCAKTGKTMFLDVYKITFS